MSQAAILPGSGPGLPTEVTAFVGRRHDRARVRQLLSDSRLVTLTGFGGIGKTRLALRLAHELARIYRDGVCWVPLGDLSDPEFIAETTAAALGIHDLTARMGLDELVRHLRDRELLLVLDNCEHLIDESARLVSAVLAHCPGVHIVATSREALRVAGEAVHAVAPLSVHGSQPFSSEAVRLLTERAGLAAPGFVVGEDNRSSILDLCRHLDGIPLALELAAVRLRAISPAELLDQLRLHRGLLDVETRGAPDRHRTMTACLEWSYELCTPQERGLWGALSLFSGGVEMDAIHYIAERFCDVPPERVLGIVQSLVDKSILTRLAQGDVTRYEMLDVLRSFGMERLEVTGSLEQGRRHHRNWYAQLLASADVEWMSSSQIQVMRRLRREEANLRLALAFSVSEADETGVGLELAARLRTHAVAQGLFSEVRVWLDRLLGTVPQPSPLRLRGLRAACWLAAMQGDRATAETLLGECEQIAEGLGQPATWVADQVAGLCALFAGDPSTSVTRLSRALEGFTDDSRASDRAESLILLGEALAFTGDLTGAAEAHAECQKICASAGESWNRSYSLWHGGLVAWQQGDLARAVELEKESLRLKRSMGERLGVAACFEAFAWMAASVTPTRAGILLGAADVLWKSMGTSITALSGLVLLQHECREKLLEQLGVPALEGLLDQGRGMEVDEAIAYALEETPTGPPRPREDTGGPKLTKREREIAELVAGGLSNKQIASRLVISPRTADTHVENILTKLGFTSRTQIATWLAADRAGSSGP